MNSATKLPLNRKGTGFNEQRSLPESRMSQPMCEVGIARLIRHFVVCRSYHFGQREVSIPLSRHYPSADGGINERYPNELLFQATAFAGEEVEVEFGFVGCEIVGWCGGSGRLFGDDGVAAKFIDFPRHEQMGE